MERKTKESKTPKPGSFTRTGLHHDLDWENNNCENYVQGHLTIWTEKPIFTQTEVIEEPMHGHMRQVHSREPEREWLSG